MDLRFTAEEAAFRNEVRGFIRDNLPAEIRERMRLGYSPRKQDTVAWQRILNKKGWATMSWPKEHGGPGLDGGPEDDLPGREPNGAGARGIELQHHDARPGADPVRSPTNRRSAICRVLRTWTTGGARASRSLVRDRISRR